MTTAPALRPGRRWAAGTPTRLRIALVFTVLAGLTFAGAGFLALRARADALAVARAESRLEVTVQTVRTRLVAADASAASDVLLGPERTSIGRRQYGYAIDEAMTKLVVAAGEDDDSLARANRRLEGYVADAAVARSLAQGRAAATRARGAPALVAASSTLRRDVLPELERAQGDVTARVATHLDRAGDAGAAAVLVGTITVAGLVVVQVWLARRTRRLVNPPLAMGTLVLVVTAAATAALLTDGSTTVERAQQGPGRTASALVEVRVAAFDARAVETLGLLTSDLAGSEERWQAGMGRAHAALTRLQRSPDEEAAAEVATAAAHLDRYGRVHADLLRTTDAAGAVRLATNPADEGSAGSFDNLDVTTSALLARQVDRLDRDLARSAALLPAAAWWCLAAGIAAAVAGGLGVGRRLAEYR